MIREEGSGTRTVTESLLQEAGIDVDRVLEVGSTAAVIESVTAGLGVAMVSAKAATTHLTIGRVKVVELPVCFKRPLYRIRLRDKPASPAARAFAEVAGH